MSCVLHVFVCYGGGFRPPNFRIKFHINYFVLFILDIYVVV